MMFRRPPPASTRPAFLPAGFALVILLGLLLSTAAAASPARLGPDLPYTLVADPGGGPDDDGGPGASGRGRPGDGAAIDLRTGGRLVDHGPYRDPVSTGDSV